MRVLVAGLTAAVLGAAAGAAAHAAGPPESGFYEGGVTSKSTYKRQGEKVVNLVGNSSSSFLSVTTTTFGFINADPFLVGRFEGKKVMAPASEADLFVAVTALLDLDTDTSHPVNLTTATMTGKGKFTKSATKAKVVLQLRYQGTDASGVPGDVPVSGKIRAKFVGFAPIDR